jgi:hypothetical protein
VRLVGWLITWLVLVAWLIFALLAGPEGAPLAVHASDLSSAEGVHAGVICGGTGGVCEEAGGNRGGQHKVMRPDSSFAHGAIRWQPYENGMDTRLPPRQVYTGGPGMLRER